MTDASNPQEQVWLLLSELFLDTDITPNPDYLARELAASPYDPGALERMLRDDVYPVCVRNLYATAGNWTGFDPKDLIQRIKAQKARRGLLHRISKPVRARSLRRMVPEWSRLSERIAAIRRSAAQGGEGIPK